MASCLYAIPYVMHFRPTARDSFGRDLQQYGTDSHCKATQFYASRQMICHVPPRVTCHMCPRCTNSLAFLAGLQRNMSCDIVLSHNIYGTSVFDINFKKTACLALENN